VYTATITLTAKEGFTLTGVAADFFTVADATATNPADSGVVTAVFPSTPNQDPVAGDYDIVGLLDTLIYDGTQKSVSVTLKTGASSGTVTEVNYEGIAPTTYTKSNIAPLNAGSYAVTFDVAAVNGWNAATLSAGTLTISPKDISSVTIDTIPVQNYTGSELKPSLTVKDGTTVLVVDTDYTVAYSNDLDEGTGTATITGIGNYTETKTADFEIIVSKSGAVLVYYWVDAHDALVTSDNPAIKVGEKATITPTAALAGYDLVKVVVDGKDETSKVNTATQSYTFTGNNKGTHYISVVVSKGTKAYSTTITVKVD